MSSNFLSRCAEFPQRWKECIGAAGGILPLIEYTLVGDVGSATSVNRIITVPGFGGIETFGVGTPIFNITDKRNLSPFVVGKDPIDSEYTTIQSALDAAALTGSPEVVFVKVGTYTENITIPSNISLVSFKQTILEGTITITSSVNVLIDSLTINPSSGMSAINLSGSGLVTLRFLTINTIGATAVTSTNSFLVFLDTSIDVSGTSGSALLANGSGFQYMGANCRFTSSNAVDPTIDIADSTDLVVQTATMENSAVGSLVFRATGSGMRGLANSSAGTSGPGALSFSGAPSLCLIAYCDIGTDLTISITTFFTLKTSTIHSNLTLTAVSAKIISCNDMMNLILGGAGSYNIANCDITETITVNGTANLILNNSNVNGGGNPTAITYNSSNNNQQINNCEIGSGAQSTVISLTNTTSELYLTESLIFGGGGSTGVNGVLGSILHTNSFNTTRQVTTAVGAGGIVTMALGFI